MSDDDQILRQRTGDVIEEITSTTTSSTTTPPPTPTPTSTSINTTTQDNVLITNQKQTTNNDDDDDDDDDDEEEPIDPIQPDFEAAAEKLHQGTSYVPPMIDFLNQFLPPRWVNWTVRLFTGLLLISGFTLIIYFGPLALVLMDFQSSSKARPTNPNTRRKCHID
ncbi:unnamed protein product [Schistosoma turkestanicum]|nr:unnamed protein product [Schistosoma turkestanicum]